MGSPPISISGGGLAFKRQYSTKVVYNPEWIGLTSLGVPRFGGAMLIYNNVLYVVGGIGRRGVTTSVEKINLQTLSRTYGSSMPSARAHFGFGVVGTKLYVIGGVDSGGMPTNTIYVYDIVNDSWSTLSATLPKNIAYCGSAVISNTIYVIGGLDSSGNILGDTYALDTSSNTVSTKASLNVARQNHACAALQGKIYCFGGDNGANPLQSIESYDPSANKWTLLSLKLPSAVTGITAIPITYKGNNYILLMGG